ncbi:MAG TPA: rhomboid family intramembrane serine protease [Bacteroidota bacterium]|nr:rhomboid family intramembrane serine protease [Bacteroidota bacterium]
MFTPWVLRLIIANLLMFFISTSAPSVKTSLMFVPVQILERPWSLVTYMFLHADVSHILFNMLSLFFFGPRLELVLGSRRFLGLYFVSGMVGALLHSLHSPETAIIGASGGIFGVMLGFGYFWPREPIYVWGVFPVEARWLIVGMTLLTIYLGFGSGDNIAHFAHLGGFLGAYLFLRLSSGRTPDVSRPKVVDLPQASREDVERWSKIPRENLHVVNREELDRILTKINSGGASTLTSTERAFLERFSSQ